MNNQKMLDVVTMIANIILPDKCDNESELEIWLRAMKRKAREALESRERERGRGNAAAIYAALVKIHDLTNALDEKCGVDPVEIRDIARAALSAPVRNCDFYVNAGDAWDAFDEWVESYRNNGKMPPLNEFGWLFAPAEERKGEKDDCART